jgi:putative redox protein
MSRSSFAPLVHGTASALRETPSAGILTFKAQSRQQLGLRSDVKVRGFDIPVDEPPALGGADSAPNPVEYALAALATCQEITYRLHADALGIPLDGVSVTVEGDIDLRGFFGVDPSIRPGFTAIRGAVSLDSPASPEDLARLFEHVNAHCPVLDLVSAPTPVTFELAKSAGAATAGASAPAAAAVEVA